MTNCAVDSAFYKNVLKCIMLNCRIGAPSARRRALVLAVSAAPEAPLGGSVCLQARSHLQAFLLPAARQLYQTPIQTFPGGAGPDFRERFRTE